MESTSSKVREWRVASGLSQAALARRAGVPASTVRRIERGEMDPTVTMLQRVAGAAGRHINLTDEPIEPSRPSLASLTHALDHNGEIDWTSLRALLDLLARHPELIEPAIATPPPRTTSARFDTLLAAIAEKLADDARLHRPRWTAAVPPLDEPWEASGTPRMRRRSRHAAPPQLTARNIWLAADNLWRTHARPPAHT